MANPKWFDADVYLNNKLAQLQATEPKTDWTEESMKAAFEEAGYKGPEGAYQHFLDYGMDEGISPNPAFDAAYYLTAKAAQLNAINYEGKTWTPGLVMDAILANGMGSAWEHYQMYGSSEGIATSETFDTQAYIEAKTALMNQTKEGGRSDWTIAEVKDAFAANGLTALEHYNTYGKAELEAEGQPTTFTAAPLDTEGYDPYTHAQSYTLADALKAMTTSSLPTDYQLSDLNAGAVSVAQYAGLDGVIAGASNADELVKSNLDYSLKDTVANIDGATASAIAGANEVTIHDSLANVAAADDALINSVDDAEAVIAFGVKAAAGGKDADVVVTTVSYGDIDGKGDDSITLVKAEHDSSAGNATISIDASAENAALGSASAAFVVDDANDAFTTTLPNVGYTFTATAKDDFLKVGSEFASVNGGDGNDYIGITSANGATIIGGNGADFLVGGKGTDVIFAGSMTKLGADKVYAEGSDTLAKGAINADATETFFGPQANSNWINPTVWSDFFKGHNIVEGREGNDTLVASSGKDLFLFQTGGGGSTGKDQELTFTELGKDTIHSFTVDEDVLFIMNQSENGDGGSPAGLNHKFSAGWDYTDVNDADNISIQWDNNYSSATVTVKADGAFGIADGGDLVITLVGVQGADANTTVADLFGIAPTA